MSNPFDVYRKPWGQGFTYKYLNTNEMIKDNSIKEWIKSLAIPPAWIDVQITIDKSSKILAIGRDSKFKKQYIYNPKFRKKKEKEKFSRMVDFAKALPKMREITSKHLKSKKLNHNKVLACMVQLLDNAYFRAGSLQYAKDNHTYGLTTLRSKHISFTATGVEFDYTGKSGKDQHKKIQSPTLSKILEDLDDLQGYEIFQYLDENNNIVNIDREMLNDYIKFVMGNKFTAKDFRTWAGTYLAATLLDECGFSECDKTNKKNLLNSIDKVASILGNTPNVAKSSYIDPVIISSYSKGVTIGQYIVEIKSEISDKDLITPQERAVMKLLNDL